jgi:23S rRNA (guanosine2251-2'-O)-methyltransferase
MTASVYKASAGAAEYMKVARVSNIASTIEELKEKGLWIFGTEMEGNTYYFDADYNCACAIIIGGEDEGIGRLIKERCDYLIKIPMMGEVSSLNASAAGAVILYEVLKQRIIGG